jgi:hypothetical protein
VGEEPEEKRQREAEHETGDDREIESGVFAAMDDVTRKAAEAERKAGAEVKEGADDGKHAPENEEGAPEFAEGLHGGDCSGMEGSDEVKKYRNRDGAMMLAQRFPQKSHYLKSHSG